MPYEAYRFNVPNTNLLFEVGPQTLRIVGGQEIGVDDTNLRYVFQEMLHLAAENASLKRELLALHTEIHGRLTMENIRLKETLESMRRVAEGLAARGNPGTVAAFRAYLDGFPRIAQED